MKILKQCVATIVLALCLSACNAKQPFYPSYLIGLSNPCESEVEFEITFNPEHQYHRNVPPQEKTSYINLGMKKELLEQLGTDFTVTISSKAKSVSYTKDEVKKYFYLAHDARVQTTHWQVDAGDLCGKDLEKAKKEHLEAIQ
ncbi:hypothetical protein [Kangiella shandongensis]|uniref:hypothetical protein n=1 Tax=Kangiella shandongensis TaxID=2763258 RepID=UPI001CBAC5AB|nr:hypothetical protein [Kangiella shandongensis]